jgi:GNAT superfamily N-acetyltransferase
MEATGTSGMLKDGTGVFLLPVSPCDRQCILDGFEQLSDSSRYSRYHAPMRSLPDGYVDSLTSADNYNSVVVAAQAEVEATPRGIGLARYVRLEDEPGVAEFSITVLDAYQNLGLGTLLLQYLVDHAQRNRIRLLRGYVLPVNQSMLRLLQRYGASRQCESDGTLCFELNPSEAGYINTAIV